LTPEAAATLVSAYILSRLDYCNSLLFNCHDYLSDRLQLVMNNAARMILRIPKPAHISPHLVTLHWLPVKSRIRYKLASLCYQCRCEVAPEYLKEMISKRERSRYNTRSSSDTSALQDMPAHSQKTLGDRCFSHAAPTVWNSLPIEIRTSESQASFKTSL